MENTNHSVLLLNALNITHNFDYPLFKDINFTLNTRESIAIIGASGTGKSTLLNIFCSLLKPNCGDVYFKKTNIYDLKQEKLLKLRRDDFGIIFQAHYLFRGFTANENLKIASLLSNIKIDNKILKQLKIHNVLSQGIGELSGGQQQRLSIARILSKKPKIIFADEPTGNLDKQTAFEVMETLFDYTFKNNAGIILVTHEEQLAFKCDKVYKLENEQLSRIK
jgi:putative ABC transport system ATP-binding protein